MEVAPDDDAAPDEAVPLDIGADDLYIAVGIDPDDPDAVSAFVDWLTSLPDGLDYETFQLEYQRQGYLMSGSGREFCYQVYLTMHDYDLDVMGVQWIRPAYVMHGVHDSTGETIDYLICGTRDGSTPVYTDNYEAANITALKAASGGGMSYSEFVSRFGSSATIYYNAGGTSTYSASASTLMSALGYISRSAAYSASGIYSTFSGSYNSATWSGTTVGNQSASNYGHMVANNFSALISGLNGRIGGSATEYLLNSSGTNYSAVASSTSILGWLSNITRNQVYSTTAMRSYLGDRLGSSYSFYVVPNNGAGRAVGGGDVTNGTVSVSNLLSGVGIAANNVYGVWDVLSTTVNDSINGTTTAVNDTSATWMAAWNRFAKNGSWSVFKRFANQRDMSAGMGSFTSFSDAFRYFSLGIDTLLSFDGATNAFLGLDGSVRSDSTASSVSLSYLLNHGFQGLSHNISGNDKSASFRDVGVSADGSVFYSNHDVDNVLDGLGQLHSYVAGPLARLQFMFASDGDLQYKASYKEQEEEVKDKFTGSGDNALSPSQIGDMAGVSGTLTGAISGDGVSVGNIGTVLQDDSVFAFFTQATADQLDSVNAPAVVSDVQDVLADERYSVDDTGIVTYNPPSVLDYLGVG